LDGLIFSKAVADTVMEGSMALKNLDFTDKAAMISAISEASAFIRAKTTKQPEIALVLGSGLGALAERLENAVVIPFADIPHFPAPTVAGHTGTLFIGELAGRCVAVMQGRVHYYEGYDTQTITFPVRVFAKLGIKSIILTNACGGVNKHFTPGNLMIIEDHLSNFCPSPLRGVNLDEFGERFIDMSQAYAPEYIALAVKTAKELDIAIQKGVYGYWQGPTYETAAEIRAYMALGADVVGMSTVAEAIVAKHCGMKILGISCITNMTCIYSKNGTNHEEVIEMGRLTADSFIKLLTGIIKKME
jgi:purine-nucleoside phosphorylase